jgi:hypothetical protein
MAKKPAAKRHYYAQIDKNTGVVIGYASGTNIDIRNSNEWQDITELHGAKQISGKVGDVLVNNGSVIKKPKLKIVVSDRRIEVGEEATFSLQVVEGDPTLVPKEIRIRIAPKVKINLELDEQLIISHDEPTKVNIKVVDDRVRLDDRTVSIKIVPVGSKVREKRNLEVKIGKSRRQD